MDIFRYQTKHNPIYSRFIELLGKDPAKIQYLHQIPFLPIELFKSHQVICNNPKIEKVFESSSTTGLGLSRHYIPSLNWYEQSILSTFEYFYGPTSDYIFLALLPGYLERDTSSLVYMCHCLMQNSIDENHGFYLNNLDELKEKLFALKESNKKILLIGVTWALLDFAATIDIPLPKNTVVMETGGMKGRKKELIRSELHAELTELLGVDAIYSEYGMTELQGMAYSKGNGIFKCAPWMKVIITDLSDPEREMPIGQAGRINVIDLANVETCSFIATSDIGLINPDGSFGVLGRIDNSDIRGCSLLAV
jgi:phenylacetate-coenzyme A ligase PaaK-like adenylate-forming protein